MWRTEGEERERERGAAQTTGLSRSKPDSCFIECVNMYRRAKIIPTPPEGGGLRSGGESMLIRACVPKIRAHNLEDISCSTLMVIGERVSSDCCLKDERLQCLSALLESGNITSFSSPRVLLLADTLRDIPSSKRSKHDAARQLPEKSRTPVLWFYQGDIAGKYIWKNKKQNPSSSPLCSEVLCDSGWWSEHSSCATMMYKSTAKRQNTGVFII